LQWKNGFDKYTDDEKTLLRKKTEDNLKENITKTLNNLGF
jgi:hypothetical protein